jgi:hypothetical protein
MSTTNDERRKSADWLAQDDIRSFLKSDTLETPWFPLLRITENSGSKVRRFAALVPPNRIAKLVKDETGWDLAPRGGVPCRWTKHGPDKKEHGYLPFGNEDGIEPLVIWREFHGMRPEFIELAQEFRLFHNLFHEPSKCRYLIFDDNGDEAEAVRYGDNWIEVKTRLLTDFLAVKQMAIAVYVESFRYCTLTLEELGLKETRTVDNGERHQFPLAIVPEERGWSDDFKTVSVVIGAKKYVLPAPMLDFDAPENKSYLDFIIGTDCSGEPVTHTCAPGKLSNFFGANPAAPNFLTPVFFRPEVLTKYYNDTAKYSVEDGYLRCGSLWGLRMDNDHDDCVVVYLGDLGETLAESEQRYWRSFNIAGEGKGISMTNFKRSHRAEFANPLRPDHSFKQKYRAFNKRFSKMHGWHFFQPLHTDDQHFLIGLRMLAKDNQAEFDLQLVALARVLIEYLNEKEIARNLTTLSQNDAGITKLEKFFAERNIEGYGEHVKFLRVLQDLRSKAVAHRKGSSYDKLIGQLGMANEGQKVVFAGLLEKASSLIDFLDVSLHPLPPLPRTEP